MNDYFPLPELDLRKEKKQVASPLLAICFIFLCSLAVQILLIVAVQAFAPTLMQQGWFAVVVSSAPMYAVAMPISLLFYNFSKAEPPQHRKKLGFLTFLGLIALCFTLSYVGNIFSTIVNAAIGAITGEPPVNDMQEMTTNTPLWANLLFVGILAPIMEEIFFRKLVIDRLLRYGELPAILISGIAFGLIHGNFFQFFYAAMMGLVFGYIYIYTGRLRYTIALHMIVNIVGGVFISEIIKRVDLDALLAGNLEIGADNILPILLFALYILFITACLHGAIVATIFFVKKIRFGKPTIPVDRKSLARIVFLNPGTWAFLAVVLLLFLV